MCYTHNIPEKGGLFTDTIDLIQRSIDYIEQNLCAQITAEDIARESGFSMYHFYRLFADAVGLPVMQYVTRRRLTHAAHQISRGMPVIEAALRYGFDSSSGFARAFHRSFGQTPGEYIRKHLPSFPEKIILKELKHIMPSQRLLIRALKHWNVDIIPQAVVHSSGVRSENTFLVGDYLLHVRNNREPLSLSMAVEECLQTSDLPSVRTLPAIDGQNIIELDGLFFRLTTRQKGTFIPAMQMYENPDHPRSIGRAIAQLHRAITPLHDLPELNHVNLLEKTLSWSLPETVRVMQLSDAFAEDFSAACSALYPDLPQIPIHRNPTPDAFLFTENILTGYANFDMTEVNVRLFDPCYAATAILSETLGRLPDSVTDCWPDVLYAILDGYHEVQPLTQAEREAVPYVVCAIQMVCVAWFSAQEQFRSLAEININMTRKIIRWLFADQY